MFQKKLLLLFLLIFPIYQTKEIFREQDTENTPDRSSITRKMNSGGLDRSDNKTENIRTNRSSFSNNVILDIEDNYNRIKKCCGPSEVLDEWYKCSERGNHDGMMAITNLMEDNLSKTSFQYQSFSCPKRKINEYSPINIFNNGSIEIEIDRNNTKIIEDYHCLDQTEIQQNYSDGVHVIICDFMAVGNITILF